MHTRHNPPTGRGLILGNALHTRKSTTQIHSIHHPTDPPTRDLHQWTGKNLSQLGCYPYSFIINTVVHWNALVSPCILTKNENFCPKYGSIHFLQFWYWTGNLICISHSSQGTICWNERHVMISSISGSKKKGRGLPKDPNRVSTHPQSPAPPPSRSVHPWDTRVRPLLANVHQKKKSKTQSDLFKIKFISGDTTQL